MIETDDFGFARPYITPGEAVLWRGKPGQGHLLTGQDIFMIPFSILWCGFAIFWETMAITSGGPIFMALWGIPFVCVGLYIVFGRFIWTAFQRKRTAYVITNKKIIRARGNRIDMIHGNSLPPMHTRAFRDGSGTISFGQHYGYTTRTSFERSYSATGFFTLENIPDVARVQQYIDQMER